MDEKTTFIKERILEIAKTLGVSYEKFLADIGTTYSNFKGKSKKTSVSSDVLDRLSSKYNFVNIEWVITGKGFWRKDSSKEVTEGLKPDVVMEEVETYGNVSKDKYIEVLEENRSLSKKIVKLLEAKKQ